VKEFGQHHVPVALPPGKNPGTYWSLDVPQSRFGSSGEEKKRYAPTGIRMAASVRAVFLIVL